MQASDSPTIKKNVPIKYIMPDTAKDFQCIMGACEDNCCRNTTWTITVDPDSYKKYQSLEGEVGRRILECIEDTGTVLKFKEFDDGKCPLMLESGLCYIHKELGGEFLCKTCATYPRVHNSFNSTLEHWLSLSCPEVVRHVLYQKNSISYVESLRSISHIPAPNPRDAEKALVRDMLVKIVSYRKLSLKEKLIYMGLFMRSIGKLSIYAPDYERSFRKTIKNYSNGLKEARQTLNEVKTNLDIKGSDSRKEMLLAASLIACQVARPPRLIPEGIVNEKYYRLMADFHKDILMGKTLNYLLETFDGKIVPYVNSKPWVFENYLMYALMSSRFLSDSNDFAWCYAGFAGEFVTMLTFACMFHEYESFGDEEMVVAMYLFHRRVSHSPVLRKRIAEKFTDNLLVFLVSALGGVK